MTNKKMLPNIIPASAKGAGTLSGPVARITLKSVEYPTIQFIVSYGILLI